MIIVLFFQCYIFGEFNINFRRYFYVQICWDVDVIFVFYGNGEVERSFYWNVFGVCWRDIVFNGGRFNGDVCSIGCES